MPNEVLIPKEWDDIQDEIQKEIIQKWKDSGILDGIYKMDDNSPMLKIMKSGMKYIINELPDITPIPKFEVGDRIKNIGANLSFKNMTGKVIYVNTSKEDYLIQFDGKIHDCPIVNFPQIPIGHGRWCNVKDLELI